MGHQSQSNLTMLRNLAVIPVFLLCSSLPPSLSQKPYYDFGTFKVNPLKPGAFAQSAKQQKNTAYYTIPRHPPGKHHKKPSLVKPQYKPVPVKPYKKPVPVKTYHKPAPVKTYKKQGRVKNYKRPGPIAPVLTTYHKPAPVKTYHKPAPVLTYHKPAPVETPAPAPVETYHKPEPVVTYHKPEPVYNKPAPVHPFTFFAPHSPSVEDVVEEPVEVKSEVSEIPENKPETIAPAAPDVIEEVPESVVADVVNVRDNDEEPEVVDDSPAALVVENIPTPVVTENIPSNEELIPLTPLEMGEVLKNMEAEMMKISGLRIAETEEASEPLIGEDAPEPAPSADQEETPEPGVDEDIPEPPLTENIQSSQELIILEPQEMGEIIDVSEAEKMKIDGLRIADQEEIPELVVDEETSKDESVPAPIENIPSTQELIMLEPQKMGEVINDSEAEKMKIDGLRIAEPKENPEAEIVEDIPVSVVKDVTEDIPAPPELMVLEPQKVGDVLDNLEAEKMKVEGLRIASPEATISQNKEKDLLQAAMEKLKEMSEIEKNPKDITEPAEVEPVLVVLEPVQMGEVVDDDMAEAMKVDGLRIAKELKAEETTKEM